MVERINAPQPFLARVRQGIGERFYAYTHAVSDEAKAQLDAVLFGIAETPLAKSVEEVRPMLDQELRTLDRRAVVGNLIATAVKTAIGASYLGQVRSARSRFDRAVYGVVGTGIVAWGVRGLGNVGSSSRSLIRSHGERMRRYYSTEAGKRAANGLGTGDNESLTRQVDTIVSRISLGTAFL